MKSHGKQLRQTVLLSPEMRAKLEAEQRRTGASLCEIVRRHIEAGVAETPAEMASPDLQARCLELLDEMIRRNLVTVVITPEKQAEYKAGDQVTCCEDVVSANPNGLGVDIWFS